MRELKKIVLHNIFIIFLCLLFSACSYVKHTNNKTKYDIDDIWTDQNQYGIQFNFFLKKDIRIQMVEL